MIKESFKQEWNNYSRVEKLGFIIYMTLLIIFIIGISYWSYISDEPKKLMDNISYLYFILVCLGSYQLSRIYYKIVSYLFCPKTEEERITKQELKSYRNKYPNKIANIKITILNNQLKIKELNKEIEEWGKTNNGN